MRAGVVRFPGSCDEIDAQLAASRVGEAVLADIEKMAETLLSNPVIENYTVRVESA